MKEITIKVGWAAITSFGILPTSTGPVFLQADISNNTDLPIRIELATISEKVRFLFITLQSIDNDSIRIKGSIPPNSTIPLQFDVSQVKRPFTVKITISDNKTFESELIMV